VCGAGVELRPRERAKKTVESDRTMDERVCINPECPTQEADSGQQA
jgi:hypothetical protein